MIFYLRDDLADLASGGDPLQAVAEIDGEVFRDKENRKTLRFQRAGRSYFLKYHGGVGWREIVKNLVRCRLPVVGAENEWRAIEACQREAIDTLAIAGFGKRGVNPARQQSFLITDELGDVVSLEEYCVGWRDAPPAYATKKALVERLAGISRRFHRAGINHRDFYLCHFLADAGIEADGVYKGPLYLIDLHRAQLRRRVPRRWLIKDLGALYFSALDLGLGYRDIIRFIRVYSGCSAKAAFTDGSAFWRAVRKRAVAIYRRDFHREPQLPL